MVTKIIPRDWQIEAFKNWKDNNYKGIVVAGTGSGKTVNAINKILSLRRNTLIIVPTETLMLQWLDEIKKFIDIPEDKIGLYYGIKKEIKPITIAIRNSVSKSDYNFTNYFKLCVYDEIHNMGSETYLEFVRNNKFKYSLGLTATLERQDGKHKDIIDELGGIIYKYDEKQARYDDVINKFKLVNVGLRLPLNENDEYNVYEEKLNKYMNKMKEITGEKVVNPFKQIPNENPSVSMFKIHYKKVFMKQKKWMFQHYLKNKYTIKLIQENQDKKIIVFNEFNDNCKILYDILKRKNLNPLLINSTNKKQLKSVLDKFSTDKYNVLITSKLLDEGFNLPSIDMGILIAGASTQKQIKQRIGRIIRKKENYSIAYQLYLVGTRDEKYNEKRTNYIDYADEYETIIV